MAAVKTVADSKLENQLDAMLLKEGAWLRTSILRPDQIACSDKEALKSLFLIRRGMEEDYMPRSMGGKMVIAASILLEEVGKPDRVVGAIEKTEREGELRVYLAFLYSKEKYAWFVESYEGMIEEYLISYPPLSGRAFKAVVIGPFEFKRAVPGDSAVDAIDALKLGIEEAAKERLQAEANVEIFC